MYVPNRLTESILKREEGLDPLIAYTDGLGAGVADGAGPDFAFFSD